MPGQRAGAASARGSHGGWGVGGVRHPGPHCSGKHLPSVFATGTAVCVCFCAAAARHSPNSRSTCTPASLGARGTQVSAHPRGFLEGELQVFSPRQAGGRGKSQSPESPLCDPRDPHVGAQEQSPQTHRDSNASGPATHAQGRRDPLQVEGEPAGERPCRYVSKGKRRAGGGSAGERSE